jgi:hypothetical protein
MQYSHPAVTRWRTTSSLSILIWQLPDYLLKLAYRRIIDGRIRVKNKEAQTLLYATVVNIAPMLSQYNSIHLKYIGLFPSISRCISPHRHPTHYHVYE